MAPPKRKAAQAINDKQAASSSKKAKSIKAMTFKMFEAGVKPLEATVKGGKRDLDLAVLPRSFNTKSFGFGANTKMVILVEVDGEVEEVQAVVSINVTVVGSKLSQEAAEAEEEDAEGEDV